MKKQTEEEKEKSIEILKQVHEIGPKKANELYEQGIRTLNDLVDAYNEGKVNLTYAQTVGLQYVEHLREKIPRDAVHDFGEHVIYEYTLMNPNDNVGEIVGSYRRGALSSGDVDIIITNNDNVNSLQELVSSLQEDEMIKHVLSLGDTKFQGTFFDTFPEENGVLHTIDIRYIEPENWGAALLHATGNKQFNTWLRAKVKSKGYSLSEHGIKNLDTGEITPAITEEEVFDFFALPYIAPENRSY
jgi:DNA polymerase/3'-5' exonuclease PolX